MLISETGSRQLEDNVTCFHPPTGEKSWRNHNIWDAFAFWIGRQRENSLCVYTGTNTFGDWVLQEIKKVIDIRCSFSLQGRQGRDLSFIFSGRGEAQVATPRLKQISWWIFFFSGIHTEEMAVLCTRVRNSCHIFLAVSLFLHCFVEPCSWRNNCLIVTLNVPGAMQQSQTKRQEGEERQK